MSRVEQFAELDDAAFMEVLRSYFKKMGGAGIVPYFRTSNGKINREKTLDLACYADLGKSTPEAT